MYCNYTIEIKFKFYFNLNFNKISVSPSGLIVIGVVLAHRPSEPRREKTGFLHMRKQRRRSASR